MKYYAVRKGKHPGIYLTWQECRQEVNGYKGAQYKSFTTKNAALNYLHNKYSVSKRQDSTRNQWSTPDILLFTDGGSRNHGNRRGDHVHQNDKAAWAFLIHRYGHNVRGTGGEYGATNNRMELMALRNALRILGQRKWNKEKINATLDSRYVLDAIQKNWIRSWQKQGWKNSSGQDIANVRLWQDIIQMLPYFPNLKFNWTKGHADNRGNIIVDQLLNRTMDHME